MGEVPLYAATVATTAAPHQAFSQKVFIKSFCKGQFPHKFVSLSFINNNKG